MAETLITQVVKEDLPTIDSLESFSVRDEDQTKPPAVIIRKPRARRLLNNLLCCFGAKNAADLPVPLQSDLSSGHYSPKPSEKLLLPPVRPCDINKKCLVIDLDETLVHSSFKPVQNPDFIIPVDVDGIVHQVYVLRRPHVDEFLRRIGELFECVLFTASLAKYADPVADLLDKNGVFRARLFREACVFHKGNFVKDLNRLGRDLKRVIIVDNSPTSYTFHPDNAIPVQSWFDDMQDTELLELLPLLERLSKVDNVYTLLRNSNAPCHVTNQNCNTSGSGNNAQIMMSNGNSPITQVTAPSIGFGQSGAPSNGFDQSGAPSNSFGQSGAASPTGAGGQSASTPNYPGNVRQKGGSGGSSSNTSGIDHVIASVKPS